jgi:hypothetical protein
VRIVQLQEPLALAVREVRDPAASELVVPALAAFRRNALGDGVCDLGFVGGVLHELDELRFSAACLVEQRCTQAGRQVIIAEVAAAQRRTRFVDRARQKHQAGEPCTRIARRPPAQADRAHQA